MQELCYRLLSDLRKIGITESFSLELRPYSKTYFGRYDPNLNKIVLYVYEDSKRTRFLPYEDLLNTLIHEAVHCIQWSSESFVRRKGVMHDAEFYSLLNSYTDKAKSMLLLKEIRDAKVSNTLMVKFSEVHC